MPGQSKKRGKTRPHTIIVQVSVQQPPSPLRPYFGLGRDTHTPKKWDLCQNIIFFSGFDYTLCWELGVSGANFFISNRLFVKTYDQM